MGPRTALNATINSVIKKSQCLIGMKKNNVMAKGNENSIPLCLNAVAHNNKQDNRTIFQTGLLQDSRWKNIFAAKTIHIEDVNANVTSFQGNMEMFKVHELKIIGNTRIKVFFVPQ